MLLHPLLRVGLRLDWVASILSPLEHLIDEGRQAEVFLRRLLPYDLLINFWYDLLSRVVNELVLRRSAVLVNLSLLVAQLDHLDIRIGGAMIRALLI